MPNIPSGNTNAAAIMTGEKAAEMIAADHDVRLDEFVTPPSGHKNRETRETWKTDMAESFLQEPPMTASVQALYDADMADDGYVSNVSRIHAYQPDTIRRLLELAADAFAPSELSVRQRGILILAAASTVGDSYCSFAWGGQLATIGSTELAATVLTGGETGLTDQEAAMASWARQIVKNPNSTNQADVQRLRDTGLSDAQIFAITAFVSLRLAFSTLNDALGAHPDRKLVASLPAEIVSAVSFGRVPSE